MIQERKPRFIRALAVVAALAISVAALSACMQRGAVEDDTERVLRIATLQGYGSDDQWFRQQFTELYEFANPNITVEIVPAVDYTMYNYRTEPMTPEEQPNPMAELKKMMQGDSPPDLVMIEFNNLAELVNENLLRPLDPLIAADQFDTTKLVPTVVDGIKEASPDGQLYALAPLFSSSALFYNRAIFEQAGVAYPADGMTWDEVFQLAQQVSGGEGADRQYGFSFNTYRGGDPFWEMQMYTQPLGLRYFDDTGDHMTVDSDQWEAVWTQVVNLRNQEIIPGPINYDEQPTTEPGPFDWDNFLSGRLAMAISSYYYINELINANRQAETDDRLEPISWDVVTVPTHLTAPGIGGSIYLQGMMGINANAQNDEDAWEFIKFVNGEDWARLKSKSQSTLVSHIDYNQPRDGMSYNIGAFYQLKPAPVQDEMAIYQKYPNIYMVQQIGQQKFQEVMDGKKEARQALKEWQTEGDAMLQQMRENPDQIPGGGMQPMPMDGGVVIEEEAAPAQG